MDIIRTTVNGLVSLGAFGATSDKYALISELWTEKAETAIGKALGVKTHRINVGETSLVGVLIAGNSKGILLPHIIAERELALLEKKLGDSINIGIVPSKLTCLGNTILTNDYGAIIHEKFEPEAVTVIQDILDVEVEKGNIIQSPLVGSHAIATNKGVLSHPLTTEVELEWLSERLHVQANVGTINRGVPFVSVGGFANSRGAVVGKDTTGPELQRLFQTLKGS